MGLSHDQRQDILALRQEMFAQVGQLTVERTQLIHNMAHHKEQLELVQAWARRLKQNVCEEHQAYLRTMTAAHLGVSQPLHSEGIM